MIILYLLQMHTGDDDQQINYRRPYSLMYLYDFNFGAIFCPYTAFRRGKKTIVNVDIVVWKEFRNLRLPLFHLLFLFKKHFSKLLGLYFSEKYFLAELSIKKHCAVVCITSN